MQPWSSKATTTGGEVIKACDPFLNAVQLIIWSTEEYVRRLKEETDLTLEVDGANSADYEVWLFYVDLQVYIKVKFHWQT